MLVSHPLYQIGDSRRCVTQCFGLGTSGWHHSQLLLGLELLLQGGSKHLLIGDRDFIIFSFLGVGEEVAQGDQGTKRKRISWVKSPARGWSRQASISARRQPQNFPFKDGFYFLSSLCKEALMSPQFWAAGFGLVQVSVQHPKNFFHCNFRCKVL